MVENLEYFKVFYYTARLGSVTGAANELSISQPAVSQSLKALERSLGAPLFQRASRGVRLTREGQLLYSYVEKGYEEIEQGVEKVRQMLNLELGEVHIGASDMTHHDGPTPETLRLLQAGKIDFGVVSAPFRQQEEFRVEQVQEIEDVFVAGRRFISYKNRMMDLQELEGLPLIFLEGNTSTRSYMNTYLSANGVELQPEFELSTSDMIVQFALRNLGIGCVVRDFAAEFLESGLLFELRFNKMIPRRQICVVTGRKMPVSAAAGKLLEIMEAG